MNAELLEKAFAAASAHNIEACANHLREMAVKETDTPALILAVAEEEIRALLD